MKSFRLLAFALVVLTAAACVEKVPERDPYGTLSLTLSSSIGNITVSSLQISDGNNLLLETDRNVDISGTSGTTIEFQVKEGTYEGITLSIATDDNRTGTFTLKSGAALVINGGAITMCPLTVTFLTDNSTAPESVLPTGRMFNMAVKALVRQSPDSLYCTYALADSNITSIRFVTESESTDGVRIDNYEGAPAYASFDSGSGALTISTCAGRFRLNDYPASMFDHLEMVETIDFGNMYAPEVNKMERMFSYCRRLKNLDLKFIENTSKCNSMDNMFSYCGALEHLDISSFDTGNVVHMRSLFNHCTSLKEIDLSNFNTANCNKATYMFYYASSLEKLDLSSFTVNQLTASNMTYFFYGLSSLKELRLGKGFYSSDKEAPGSYFCDSSMANEERTGYKAGKLTIYCDQATADWLARTNLRWINSGYNKKKAIPVTFIDSETGKTLTVKWAAN